METENGLTQSNTLNNQGHKFIHWLKELPLPGAFNESMSLSERTTRTTRFVFKIRCTRLQVIWERMLYSAIFSYFESLLYASKFCERSRLHVETESCAYPCLYQNLSFSLKDTVFMKGQFNILKSYIRLLKLQHCDYLVG